MRCWWLAAFWIAGCYRPATEAPCTVHCEYAGEQSCPGAQECQLDNLCHAPGGGCDEDVIDADITPIDLPSGGPPYCFGSGLVHLCMPTLATAIVDLPVTIDTDNDPMCITEPQAFGPALCVIYGRIVRDTNGTVRAEGVRPLLLLATESIQISHGIDVATHRGSIPGAGASPPSCLAPSPPTIGGGGGAAGGTNQGTGGSGGATVVNNEGKPAPAFGVPPHVRGGCAGGVGSNGTVIGSPGRGGGAVYLIAATSISVGSGAQINASGAGALAGDGSGNGGGSGGMIGLDAAIFQVQGQIFANGGGGSSGFNNSMAFNGRDSISPLTGGGGGFSTDGGSGGTGSAGTSLFGLQGASGDSTINAGGGGGGAGFILVYPTGHAAMVSGPNVSPPAL